METDETVYREYLHAPSHLFLPESTYIVTASTYKKELLFNTPQKRDYLLKMLFQIASNLEWELEAWAIMANHYHFVAQSKKSSSRLNSVLQELHAKTARRLNKIDETPGRKVWFQYWDTCLTNQHSYYARLNYVHNNPTLHRLVGNAENYRWCSMKWFINNAESELKRCVQATMHEHLNVPDDF